MDTISARELRRVASGITLTRDEEFSKHKKEIISFIVGTMTSEISKDALDAASEEKYSLLVASSGVDQPYLHRARDKASEKWPELKSRMENIPDGEINALIADRFGAQGFRVERLTMMGHSTDVIGEISWKEVTE